MTRAIGPAFLLAERFEGLRREPARKQPAKVLPPLLPFPAWKTAEGAFRRSAGFAGPPERRSGGVASMFVIARLLTRRCAHHVLKPGG